MEHIPDILHIFKLNCHDDHFVPFEAEKMQQHNHGKLLAKKQMKLKELLTSIYRLL